MILEDFKKNGRKATHLEVGGFEPTGVSLESCFGDVSVASSEESWPLDSKGRPMLPLCQLNLADLRVKLSDEKLIFLTVFVSCDRSQLGENNGDGWVARTYESLDQLQQVECPSTKPFKKLPIRVTGEATDWPSYDEAEVEFPEEVDDEYEISYPNFDGLKIGGWPSLMQGYLTVSGRFEFQIPSIPKASWVLGDSGIAYFLQDDGQWKMEWQCY